MNVDDFDVVLTGFPNASPHRLVLDKAHENASAAPAPFSNLEAQRDNSVSLYLKFVLEQFVGIAYIARKPRVPANCCRIRASCQAARTLHTCASSACNLYV